jgi:hypothetical protein
MADDEAPTCSVITAGRQRGSVLLPVHVSLFTFHISRLTLVSDGFPITTVGNDCEERSCQWHDDEAPPPVPLSPPGIRGDPSCFLNVSHVSHFTFHACIRWIPDDVGNDCEERSSQWQMMKRPHVPLSPPGSAGIRVSLWIPFHACIRWIPDNRCRE